MWDWDRNTEQRNEGHKLSRPSVGQKKIVSMPSTDISSLRTDYSDSAKWGRPLSAIDLAMQKHLGNSEWLTPGFNNFRCCFAAGNPFHTADLNILRWPLRECVNSHYPFVNIFRKILHFFVFRLTIFHEMKWDAEHLVPVFLSAERNYLV